MIGLKLTHIRLKHMFQTCTHHRETLSYHFTCKLFHFNVCQLVTLMCDPPICLPSFLIGKSYGLIRLDRKRACTWSKTKLVWQACLVPFAINMASIFGPYTTKPCSYISSVYDIEMLPEFALVPLFNSCVFFFDCNSCVFLWILKSKPLFLSESLINSDS